MTTIVNIKNNNRLIVKKLPESLSLKVEDLEDLILLRYLVFNGQVKVIRKIHNKRVPLEKQKQPIIEEVVSLRVKETLLDKHKLTLRGVGSKGPRSITLTCNSELELKKNLNNFEITILKKAKLKKILYICVESDSVLIGEILDHKFKELHRKYFAFRNVDFEDLVFKSVKPWIDNREYPLKVYKTNKVFVELLQELLPLNWKVLENDPSVDWKQESLYGPLNKELSKDLEKSSLLIRFYDQLKENHLLDNISKIYLTDSVSDKVLELINEKSLIDKIVYLKPFKEHLRFFKEEGFIGLKYFNP